MNVAEVKRFILDNALQSQLPTIPVIIFETFPLLNYLKLNTAGLRAISQMDFQNASKLCSLQLCYNQIQLIPADVFLFAQNLQHLDLSHNEIADLANQSMNGLIYLRVLKLAHNRIHILRKHALRGATNLECLNMESNDLETIEDDALHFPHLIEVIFRSNKLKSLSEDVFQKTPNINFIDFGFNELIKIGRAFYSCDSVQSLNLDGNPLDDVNLTALADMQSLTRLSLNDTRFKGVALNAVASRKSILTRLSLANNRLANEDVFHSLAMFGKLKVLLLNDNRFQQLPPITSIKNLLPELSVINLVHNERICDWYNKNEVVSTRLQIQLVVGECTYY